MFKSNSLQKKKKKNNSYSLATSVRELLLSIPPGRGHSAPERDHVAQLGGQAAELIGRQVQVDQVGQFGDVWWETGQVVVVDVQRREVGERP